MKTCLFCGKELEVGKVHHESSECKDKISEVNNYLEKDDRITVGVATCGLAAGAKKSLDVLRSSKLSMPVDEVGCSGMCFNEPIVSVRIAGKTFIYGEATEDKIRNIIKTIKDGTRHDDCFIGEKLEDIEFFKKQKRVLMSNCGLVSPLVVEHYIAREGYKGLMHAVELDSGEIIAEIKKSGLRGRGGAGFPTHMKWDIFSKSSGEKYLVVNGDEGDPGAFMNRTLIESDPFRILEGFTIASRATGAKKGIIYTRAEYPLAVETLEKAISICEENNLLGKDILGIKGFDF
ncbi:NADH-quinone oxidoreductase subunit F, partial [Candidatus Woesearchaeota archaeon]|nr:NADH-quinone oxidoreductase subunit F [Candidatus Woesearchaeota archaeon]